MRDAMEEGVVVLQTGGACVELSRSRGLGLGLTGTHVSSDMLRASECCLADRTLVVAGHLSLRRRRCER